MQEAGDDILPENVADALGELDREMAEGFDEARTWDTIDQEALQEVAEQTLYGEIFLADLVSRQLTLSLAVAITFLTTLFAVPLFNYFAPSIASLRVLGFTVSWLFVGVLIYPLIWGLAYYFVGTCKKYEDDFTRFVK